MSASSATTFTATGPLPAAVGNAVSDALHDAMTKGMDADVAVCIAVTVACDYGRLAYGDRYLDSLAECVLFQKNKPLAGTDSSVPSLSSSPPGRATGLARPGGPSLTGTDSSAPPLSGKPLAGTP